MTRPGRASASGGRLLIGALAGLLGACATLPHVAPAVPATSAQAVAETETADLLAAGERLAARLARRPGDVTVARRLDEIAATLAARGAQPAEGEGDLVHAWQQQANQAGAAGPAKPPLRGRVLGPLYRRGTLAARGSATSEQAFLGGQPARVVLGPANGALALELYDEPAHRRVRCRQGAARACEWLPLYTQRVRLVVRNTGSRPQTYFLTME